MNPALVILEAIDRAMEGRGELRLLGGAALLLGYGLERSTEDVDLLLDQAELEVLVEESNFGNALARANEELEPLGLYLSHIWGPEQQILSEHWRENCRRIDLPSLVRLTVSVLGPLDLLLSKLCRADEGDLADIAHLLAHERLTEEQVREAMEAAVVPKEFSEVFPRSRARVEALFPHPAQASPP